jgi:hypothetical protein
MDKIEVKVGQIWEDWDIRSRDALHRRKIKVIAIVDGKAIVKSPSGYGGSTKIKLERFRPTSTGYRLVSDV